MNANKQPVYLTQKGRDDLRNEYDDLIGKKRPQLVARVARARDFGDLTENSEYAAAREELDLLDKRIDELEDLLRRSKLLRKNRRKNDKVVLGSTVSVAVDGDNDVYTIVESMEAEPESGKISQESPVGQALMGKKVGDKVKVKTPHTDFYLIIRKIS